MLEDLERQLLEQRDTLTSDIRNSEAVLTNLKETYLKVLGALEVIGIQKKSEEENKNSEISEDIPVPM